MGLGLPLLALAAAAVAAQDVEVFLHGQAGYPCIRTPSLITTGGALVAFAGTRFGPGDGCIPTVPYNKSCDHDDTVMRKSTDRGVSWGPIRVLSIAPHRGGKGVRNHGASLWDAVGKQIVLVLSVAPTDTLAVIRSSDEGETWTPPRPLHELGDDSGAHISPGRGLQLSPSHAHAGRILFVAQLSVNTGNVIFYSDDGGKSWAKSPTIVQHCNEAQMVELADGRLLLNARDEDHRHNASVASGARRFSHSLDGGHTWEPLGVLREDLGDTNCMGSFLAADAQSSALLFSHPNAAGRINGTVWISHDQAQTFSPLLAVTPANSSQGFAYSCMTRLPAHAEGTAPEIGLLYETGDPGRCKLPRYRCHLGCILLMMTERYCC